jgi:tRNA 2-thiouridine synthesizing protein A
MLPIGRDGGFSKAACAPRRCDAVAMVIAKQLDLTGLTRPAPVARTAEALAMCRPGDLLEVIATDQSAVPDFCAWAEATGQDLIETSQLGHVFRFVIRRH